MKHRVAVAAKRFIRMGRSIGFLSIGLFTLFVEIGFLRYLFKPENYCDGFGGIDGSVTFHERAGLYLVCLGCLSAGAACLSLALTRVWGSPFRRVLLVALGLGIALFVVGVILGTDAYFERCG